jgi:hypothetical protein
MKIYQLAALVRETNGFITISITATTTATTRLAAKNGR